MSTKGWPIHPRHRSGRRGGKKLELHRLEHALAFLGRYDEVTGRVRQLAESLQAQAAVKSALDEQNAHTKADVERTAREGLDPLLAKERAALQAAVEQTDRASNAAVAVADDRLRQPSSAAMNSLGPEHGPAKYYCRSCLNPVNATRESRTSLGTETAAWQGIQAVDGLTTNGDISGRSTEMTT